MLVVERPTIDLVKVDEDRVLETLRDTLTLCERRAYTGWDKHDGLHSRFLELTRYRYKWLNLFSQELVKRAPLNVRPALGIRQERSFKGAALFTLAHVDLFRLWGEEAQLRKALALADWLIENRSIGYSGFCGGHRHPRQQLDQFVPADTPAIVPTAFAVRALLEVFDLTQESRYLEVAQSAVQFVLRDLEYKEFDDFGRVKYKPVDSGQSFTLNANALGAHLLMDLCRVVDEPSLKRIAKKILTYVVSKQGEDGGWMYTDPPTSSHVRADNYHNGFILESLLRYEYLTGDMEFYPARTKGVCFYRETLMNPDGSPNWDETSAYPRDIHACAEAILLFSKLGELDSAARTVKWTLDNLYNGRGEFFYQKRRTHTARVVLMRWGQAWMCYALSSFLRSLEIPYDD